MILGSLKATKYEDGRKGHFLSRDRKTGQDGEGGKNLNLLIHIMGQGAFNQVKLGWILSAAGQIKKHNKKNEKLQRENVINSLSHAQMQKLTMF